MISPKKAYPPDIEPIWLVIVHSAEGLFIRPTERWVVLDVVEALLPDLPAITGWRALNHEVAVPPELQIKLARKVRPAPACLFCCTRLTVDDTFLSLNLELPWAPGVRYFHEDCGTFLQQHGWHLLAWRHRTFGNLPRTLGALVVALNGPKLPEVELTSRYGPPLFVTPHHGRLVS